jgi:cytochrome c oxidase subunit 3
MAQGESTQAQQAHYAVPQPMPWPIMGSAALFCMALGGVFVINAASGGWVGIALGLMLLLYMMFRWFGDVIRESEGGKYGGREDFSFRWGMSWFIFTEVMFFGAFFGALFWARVMSVPDLATIESNALMWPGFTAHWPSAGPGFAERFSPVAAWGIPAINTLLLLSSGATVTIAHWALKENNRRQLIIFLALTILLGVLFLLLQAYDKSQPITRMTRSVPTAGTGTT